MLDLVRAERPNQNVQVVKDFKFNEEFGFYDVNVVMETKFTLDGENYTTIKKAGAKIPYPIQKYLDLPANLQTKWRLTDYMSVDEMINHVKNNK